MTDELSAGGADSWRTGGAAALAMYAPEVLTSYGLLVSVRPSGVHDELLESPDVTAFAEQFGAGAGIDAQVRDRFAQATGDRAPAVVDMVWISDVAPRIRGALDALFGASDEWPGRRRYPVADTQVAIQGFLQSVALLDTAHAGEGAAVQAARALADAVARTPAAIPGAVVEAVHQHLTPVQAVQVVLAAASRSYDTVTDLLH